MSINKDLWFDGLLQKTFIQVDEKKTEAAAVTEVVMTVGIAGIQQPPPPPKIFNADHSFTFFIIDNRTSTVLFIGRLVEG